MGDRANIRFQFEGGDSIYLYGHWAGPSLAVVLAQELGSETARDRWNDESYLARILVHRVLNHLADADCSTGFGLSPGITDNEYHILVLDLPKMRWEIQNEAGDVVHVGGTYDALATMPTSVLTTMVGG